MKNLEDFKAEINKCSKCGLCQSVCPVYKITGNECAVSRGKFVMLDGVLKGDLELNKNINKYIDLCLKCGKCSAFCPASINVCDIFNIAKFQYAKKTLLGKFIFFLESKYVFGLLLKISSLFLKRFKNTFSSQNDKLKVLYFRGCANTVFPQSDKILRKFTNVEIIEKDFDCCGVPFLSSGNLERFEQVKEHNKNLFAESDFDYVLTDCASCESALKEYIDAKFISLGELVLREKLHFKFKSPLKVTFHKPCHQESIEFLKPLLQNCENIEYIEMEDYDDCCGFAGEFAIKNKEISKAISNKKAQNILNTGADIVITTCPSCILGLKQGLFNKKNAPKVLTLSQFLQLGKCD